MFSKSQNIFDLSGKIIIITGATGLLGKQHSEAVASFNGTPILIDLSQKKINDFAKYLNTKYKVKSLGFRVDITKEGEIKDNVAEIIKRFGKVDGLINNAANNPKIENKNDTNFSRLENFSLDLWDKDILVGLTGSFLCSKHYGFAISKNSNGGSIINITSLNSELGFPNNPAYVTMKGGLKQLTKSMSVDLGKYNIWIHIWLRIWVQIWE